MKTAAWALSATLVTSLLLEAYASPLGGSHAPPAPPPPPWHGPGDTVPPPSAGGSGGGAPGPGSTGGPATPGPAGPGVPGPSAPGGSGGPSTPAGGVQLPDLSDWTWWWNYNKHGYLQLKHHILSDAVQTGSDEFYLGTGQTLSKTDYSVEDAALIESIGPALQRAVESGSSRVQSDALLAIVKLHPVFEPEGKSMTELISAHLTSSNQKTAESAVVALGLMGDVRNLRLLSDIAQDNAAGRKHMDRTEVPGRTRPLAALALGAMGPRLEMQDARRMIVSELALILNADELATPDLHVAAVTAFGLNPLPSAGGGIDDSKKSRFLPSANLESQVRYLMELFQEDDRHEAVRAHAPRALALLAQDAPKEVLDYVKEGLLDELERRKRSDRLVRYGIVEALGMVGDADDEVLDVHVREALHLAVAKSDNNQRGLALIALALVSSRGGESSQPYAALLSERRYLIKQLAVGKSRLRPWTALAIGLQGHYASLAGKAPSNGAFTAVLESLRDTKSPADAGAYYIALGLLGDPRGFEILEERLEGTSDDDARGFAAVGLGLLGELRAVELLQAVVEESEVRHIPLHQASVGLALLGQKQAVEPLLESLAAAKSAEKKSHQLVVLGDIGDKRAVDAMVALLDSDDELEQARGYAATSLGIVCEQNGLPWTADFMNHLNYHATTETLITGKGTGLLNLR